MIYLSLYFQHIVTALFRYIPFSAKKNIPRRFLLLKYPQPDPQTKRNIGQYHNAILLYYPKTKQNLLKQKNNGSFLKTFFSFTSKLSLNSAITFLICFSLAHTKQRIAVFTLSLHKYFVYINRKYICSLT